MDYDDLQKISIEYPINNSIFITAPPGYGKTFILIERIKYLISKGNIIPPQKILAMTFSNAAANEMKKRIRNNLPKGDIYIDVMNYHSLAYFILKAYGNYIGISRNFSLVDEKAKDQFKRQLFQEYVEQQGIRRDTYAVIRAFDIWYNIKYLQSRTYESKYDGAFEHLRKRIDQEFVDSTHLDFDHLLFKAIELLKNFKDIKDAYFNKYKMILADEFQDTNYLQYQLFKEISMSSRKQKRPVFVVGDKRQAIMGFQGARPENIDALINDFNCGELELQDNHRTNSEKIKSLIKELREPFPKIDVAHSYLMYINDDLEGEHSRVIQILNSLLQFDIKLHDVCILFPQMKSADLLKRRLDIEKIPYVIMNDFRMDSIKQNYSDLFSDIKHHIDIKYNNGSLSEIIRELIKKHHTHMDDDLILSTIQQFSALLDIRMHSNKTTYEKLIEFDNYLQMDFEWSQTIKSRIRNKLFISTIHGAKGLEFDYVLMMGIVNFRMPHSTLCMECSNLKQIETDEAIDLFYVGISRAIKDLFFFFCKQDEQNRKRRKISCVYNNIIQNMKFIDSKNQELTIKDKAIKDIVCNYQLK